MSDKLVSQGNNTAPRYRRNTGGLVDCIVASQVVTGNADFFSVAGLNLTLEADATDPFEYNIGGTTYQLLVDVVFAVTDNAHNFIWIDDTGALGRQATPPLYSFTAPGAPAAGDHWYDLGKGLMKSWSGAAWVAVNRIFIGYVRADAAAIDARYVCEPVGGTPLWRWENFGDGSDGFLNITAGTTTLDQTKQYTAVVISGSGNLTHTANYTQGTLSLYVQGVVALIGSATINLNGKGRFAGAASVGVGNVGSGGAYGGVGGGGGGGTSAAGAGGPNIYQGGGISQNAGGTAGTGGGGAGGNGAFTGLSVGGVRGAWLHGGFGSGGGSGGGDGAASGAGGVGGGSISIWAAVIAVAAGASITANGNNGSNGPAANRGAGGGGGGGTVDGHARNFFITGTYTSTKGAGGNSGGAGSGAGGAGSDGRALQIRI